jgi:hypothetical protein
MSAVRAVALAIGIAATVVSFVACHGGERPSFITPRILHETWAHGVALGVSKDVVDRAVGSSGSLRSAMMGNVQTYGYGTCAATGRSALAVTYGGGVAISITWVPCGAQPSAGQSLALARSSCRLGPSPTA